MGFLEQFTLYDVFLVAIGLITASIVRIFYDSYKERKRLEELDELIAVYNESMNTYDEGIIIISDNHEILFSNNEAHRILRKDQDNLTVAFLNEEVTLRMQNSVKEEGLLTALGENATLPNAWIAIGQYTVSVAVSSHTFQVESGTAKNVLWRIVTLQDNTGKVKLQEKIESTGFSTDILTGLPVKHHLSSKLLTVISAAMQARGAAALGMLGINDYHYMQSKHGIEKIDTLLKSIVKTLSEDIKENEVLYRFDHDSLAIVFEEVFDVKVVEERVAYFKKRIKDILMVQRVVTDVVDGVYFIQRPYPSAAHVLDGCLNTLYYKSMTRSKRKESTQFLKESESKVPLPERLGKKEFKNAIKNNDFFVFYQPIYALKKDKLIGVEVLSRLNYKKEGILMPEFFLQQATECNMMTEVTAHLLDRVLSQKRFWSVQMNRDLDTTINLGISDIRSGVFTEMLEKKMIEYDIDSSMVTIDISEEVLEMDYEAVFEECYMLNKLGVKLAIDHFGKGSISLNHLTTLPLHAIKMDKSMIAGITEKEEKLRLVSGIISMGRKLDMEVGATFVDSGTVKTLLGRINCHFAQGNYLGKAVPAFEITDLMQST